MLAQPLLARWRDSLAQDLRYSLRGLHTRPGFALIVVFTIALGVGADATMFGVLDRILFRAPDQIRDPDRVVQVETHSAGSAYWQSSCSYATYTDFRDQAAGFDGVAATYSGGYFPLDRGSSASRVAGSLVSSSFFSTLGVRPAAGRFFSADEDNVASAGNVAVIGYGFWQRHFNGRESALGQTLNIGVQRYTVVGVAPKGFTGVDLNDVDVWLPITAPSGLRFDNSPGWTKNRHANWLHIVARLKGAESVQLATQQATAVHRGALRQQIAEDPKAARYIKPDSESVVLASLIPGKVSPGMSAIGHSVKVSQLLGVVSLIVLIIACANVANLLLVRAFNRQREIVVRLALGVSRGRLITQLLVEGLVLATLGGGGALLVAHWTSQSVRIWLLGAGAWTAEAVDGRLLAFTAVATLVTGLVTSLVPALRASRTDLAQALKQGVREGGGQRSPLRAALLMLQAALAIVMLTGAGLFIRSVQNVNALPFGVDVDHVLVADIAHASAGLTTEEARRLYDDFNRRVRSVPGVKSAAVTIGLPFGLSWSTSVAVPGRVLPKTEQEPVQYAVTPDYFTTMGIRLRGGRAFTVGDRMGTLPVAMINETMATLYWPNQNPVGQCAKIDADTMPCTTIIGVVGNTRRQNLVEGLVPQLYRPLDQLPTSAIDHTVSHFGYELVVKTDGDPARLVEPVRRAIHAAAAVVPYANVRPMRDLLDRRMRSWQLGARVFSAFGALALVLAAVGLYSVLAFTIAQRTHEFGLRVALGAQSADIVRVALATGLAPVVGGIVGGVLLSLLSGKFVAGLLFGVSPRDPMVLAGVAGILLVTGIVASVGPALKAGRGDLVRVLREE